MKWGLLIEDENLGTLVLYILERVREVSGRQKDNINYDYFITI